MPDKNTDAAAKLKKLGEHLRRDFAKRHPISEKSLETVRNAVREQYEQEQKAEREKKPTSESEKTKDHLPDEPSR